MEHINNYIKKERRKECKLPSDHCNVTVSFKLLFDLLILHLNFFKKILFNMFATAQHIFQKNVHFKVTTLPVKPYII